MSPREKIRHDRTKSSPVSMVLYIASIIAAIIAIASLVITITFFNFTVSQYVAQGYTASDVYKQLLPSQLYPGMFQSVAGYGGIAVILFGLGKIIRYAAKCMALLNRTDDNDQVEEENNFANNTPEIENGENP